MSTGDPKKQGKSGKKVRVEFRRNRSQRARQRDWTQLARESEDHEVDAHSSETVAAKGELSRRRTVIVRDENAADRGLVAGRVIAMRGLYAEVDTGELVWPCTVRRVLRTRLIGERNAVTVGDRVLIRTVTAAGAEPREGVVEEVEPRSSALQRQSGRRIQTLVANVDQVIIVSTAAQPAPKPHLIDRYVVAALAGDMTPIVCMNKVDLDPDGCFEPILALHDQLGYRTLRTSCETGAGIDELRAILAGKASVLSGQSGVGKSSLLNAVQPGLQLRVGIISEQIEKGRHTTVTARLLKLDVGGYVVDTPGIRSFDLSPVDPGELEAFFADFLPYIPNCKFPDCTHTHEHQCAVKQAVEAGDIHPQRYESYLHILEDRPE